MSDPISPGYYIERIFAQQLAFEGVPQAAELPDKFAVTYAWEWAPVDEQSFFVILAARGTPGKDRPESITVSIAGRFRREGQPEAPPFVDFVKVNATTILVPYVREAFSNLSGRGIKNPLVLGPLNVIHWMSTIDFASSVGAQRVSQRPDLVAAYGIPPEVMLRIAPPAGSQQEALPVRT